MNKLFFALIVSIIFTQGTHPYELIIRLDSPSGSQKTFTAEKADQSGVYWDDNGDIDSLDILNGGTISIPDDGYSGWHFIGIQPGSPDTLGYGLYKIYCTDNNSGYFFIDYRDCNYNLQCNCADTEFKYWAGVGKFKAYTYTNIDDEWIENGDTLNIWELKEFSSRSVNCFRPSQPTNLQLSISGSHPYLSWSQSNPITYSKYNIYRRKCEQNGLKEDCDTWGVINSQPISNNNYIDYSISYNPQGDTYKYRIKAIIDNWIESFLFSNIKSTTGWAAKILTTYIDTTHFNVGNIYSEFTNDGRLGFSFTNNAGTFWPNATEEIVFEHGFWLIGKTNENTENETLVGAVPEFDANYTPGPMINGEAAVLATPDDFEAYRTYVIDGNSGPGDEDYDNWPSEWGPPIHSDGTPKLMGDKMAWTIYNDAHPDVHGWLETNDGGDENNTFLEVRETVWGFNDGEYESDALFYKYQVFNKGADTLTNLTISHWNDIDIMSLTWNDWGFNEDHNFGFVYYNNDSANVNLPKAVSYFLIQGPMIPEIGATAHAFGATFENRTNLNTTAFWGIGDDACSPQNYGGSPSNLIQAYNFTLGLQYDGSPIVNPVTGEETTYTFTGDPVTNEGWVSDDYCHGGMTGYIMSSGPLTLAPGDSQEVVIGLVGSSESTIEASLIDLQTKVEYLRDLYYDQLSIQEPIPIPDDFLIVKHYPNPFNPSVQFEIEMKKESLIVMTIFNIKGELIWQKKMGIKERGIHTLSWDAKNLNQEFLAAGVYLYRVNAGNHIQTGKVVYVK